MNLQKILSKKLGKKFFSLIAIISIMGQGIFAPFVGVPIAYATPWELPHENISANMSISGNVADTLVEETSIKNTIDDSWIASISGNVADTLVGEVSEEDLDIKVQTIENDDEKKVVMNVSGTSSAIDLSSGENIEKSIINVTKNATESVKDVLIDTIDEAVVAINSVNKMTRGVTRFRSAGNISTTGSTDLVIKIDGQTEAENNRLLTYKVTIENLGPSDAHGTNMKLLLPAWLRKIKLVCKEDEKVGSVVCPNEERYTDGSREINRIIENLPVGSKLVFDLIARLPMNPPSSVNYTVEAIVPAGMLDISTTSNQASINTRIVGGRADVAVTQITPNIPAVDMQPRVEISDPERRTSEIIFDNPQPISYTVRYENKWPGYADGSGISFWLDMWPSLSAYRKLEYEDMIISCQASNDAICPSEFKLNNNSVNLRNGWKQTGWDGQARYLEIFHERTTFVPEMPAHSYIDVTVTFTPKKISIIDTTNACYDRTIVSNLGVHEVQIAQSSYITDPVSSNNRYVRNTLEQVMTTDSLGDLTLPEMHQVCPVADLAITAVGQNFSGNIETEQVLNEEAHSYDLIVKNPKPLSFTIKYENKGWETIIDAGMVLQASLPSYTYLDYEDLSFSCSAKNGAECPTGYLVKENTVWPRNGTMYTTSGGYINFFNGYNRERSIARESSAHGLIPRLPANGSVEITVSFVPKKIRSNRWDRCGTWNYLANLSLFSAGIQDLNRYVSDPDESNNRAIYAEPGHLDITYMSNIRTTDISLISFGSVNQKACPSSDLAVTKFSQSFVGDLDVEYKTSENRFYTYPEVKNPQPITFSVKYENLGGDEVRNARILFSLRNDYHYSGTSYVNIRDLEIYCTPHNGAECPVALRNFNENKTIDKTLAIISNWKNIFQWDYWVVPKMPIGSSLEFIIKMTPYNATASHTSCWATVHKNRLYLHEVSIATPADIKENDESNNTYNTYNALTPTSFQRISEGDIGYIVIGDTRQSSDVCKRSGVSVEVEHSNIESHRPLEAGKEFEYDVIYKNTSDVAVENIAIKAEKWNQTSHYQYSAQSNYSGFNISCESTNGAICPVAQPLPSSVPYGNTVDQSTGIWNYVYKWSSADNILFNTTIPLLPAHSEVRMKVRYVLDNPRIITFDHSTTRGLYEEIIANAILQSSIYASNDGRLRVSERYNHIYLTDAYINTKFVIKNVADGECVNPTLMDRDGVSQATPNTNLCLYTEIGNAGVAEAHDFPFVTTVPAGLTNINPSEITCTVRAGGENTICGNDIYFDPDTRELRGTIKKLPNGGKVTITLPGRTVDYSSSWKSISTIMVPSGWYERLPETNRSEQNFSIAGNDPSISKSVSVRAATAGDQFDYTIVMRNPNSGESLKNVKITDLLPDSFYYMGTNDIDLRGGATAENPSISRDSLVENISGSSEAVDADIDAWKRPIRNDEWKLEWNSFAVPVGGSVTVSFKVKVKESYSCQEIIHNSAWTHYSRQNDIASTRSYIGNLVGFDLEDIELIGCKEITANTDIIKTRHEVRDGKTVVVPDTFNIFENDTVHAPAKTNISARDITAKVENIRNLDKEILYLGSSDGVSSKGKTHMTGGFKLGNRFAGKGDVTPVDTTNAGLNVFDYKELPDLSIDENGNISWKKNLPTGKYLGAYTICDKVNTLNCSTAPIIVVVPDSENHPPIAVADTEKTLVNNPIEIDVLKNDSDPDDDTLVITNVENAQNGQFIIENRKIKFTPAFDFFGEATAEYTISDGRNGTAKARITVLVEKNINLPPVAVNDSAMIDMNTDILLNVLENDSDPEREAITLESVNVINNSGTAEVRDGKMYFKPKQDFVGVAVVTYTIKDTSENRANGVAVITVINNTAPTAVDDVENILKNEKITLAVLENDTDPENDRLTIERIENPQNGTFNIVGNKVEFTPNPDFVGEARAVYHIFDGTNGRASANIIITVSEAIPPVAVDDTAETEFNTTKEIDVLANDSDPKKNPLTIISVENEENGKFEIISNKIKFTPNQDFHGTATARYTISNGKNGTASANITVTVKEAPLPPPPANNPPVANNDEVETGKNAPVLINVLANDSDADRDVLTITSISNQENGTFVKEDDKVRFTPTPDFVGNAKAIYTIDDGKGGVAYATIVVVVKPEPTFTATESLEKTGPFVKQCGPKQNTTPVNFTHKITETYVSKISRADAEEKVRAKLAELMEAEFNVKGQQHAEENGVCNDNPPDTFTANETLERTGDFSKVCGPKQHTTPVRFTHRIADSYTSNISLEDAKEKLAKILRDRMDAEFNEKGQTYANENGVCINNAPDVFTATESLERAKDFSKQCAPNQYTTPVNFVHKITLTETSNISLVDAQNKVRAKLEEKMNAEFDRLGQANAEQNGVCNDNTYSATENLSKTGKFFKNNCAVDTFANGVDFTHTITETATSNISEEDARTKVRAKLIDRMNAEFERLGQDYANANDTCTDVPTFTATDSLTHSGKFTRNNCSEEETTEPVEFTHTVTDTYVSKVSQEDANIRLKLKLLQKMNEEFAIKGQIFANENGVCTPKPKFTATKSLEKTGDFTPKCDEGFIGKPVSYTHKIEETYISKISQEDAEMHAERILDRRMAEEFETAGQTHANENGECLPIQEATDTLTKTANFSKVCKAGQISKPVSFTHTITVTKSSVSLEEAKKLLAEELQAKMEAEFDKLGNKYAEENGKCDYPTSSSSSSSSSTTKTIIIGCADKNAVNYNSSVTQHDEKSCKYEGEPLFSAPVIGGQCISAVKNLDDPKLIAYYDDLKIMNRDNVHRQISRVEFIKLVLNAGKVDLEKFSDTTNIADFSDIDLESWYAPYVSYMIATATMNGQEITDENGNITKIFRPNDTISRAEASKILSELVRKTGQALPTIEEITSFTDVDPSASLSPYIQFAYNSCLLHGRNTIDGQPIDGKPRVFEPADSITLAETAKVLYNITHSNVNNDEKFKEIISNVEKFFAEKVEKNTENTESSDKKNNTTEEKTETQSTTQNISTPLTSMLKPTLQVGGQTFDLNTVLKP